MTSALQVFTTTGDRDEADAIAQRLVEQQLAACVQVIGPITSTYRWEGAVESGIEWLCIIKTDEAQWEAVEQAIRELHSYDVPEIVAMPITVGHTPYLAWLKDAVRRS